MKKKVDALIIGAGSAGLAAALRLKKEGVDDILLVEREDSPGGILLQCIHNGFGLHMFKEELTGPEYAERYIKNAQNENIEIWTNTCALDIIDHGEEKEVILLSGGKSLVRLFARAIILAMGCREKNRGNIAIPGSRPSGIMTAGFAQKMANIYGYLPGKEIVILGSGDIGLIMARRLMWEGSHVKAVIEVQSTYGGLTRNIAQCLNDFKIPLYLSHAITNITGTKRIETVEISPIDKHLEPQKEGTFTLSCDCLLLSVGLIPENELSLKAGIILDEVTRGALVDASLMTSVTGIFACGNVLQVHDLVDYVSEEADYCGKKAALFIKGELIKAPEVPVRASNLVRYVLPRKVEAGKEAFLSLRSMAPAENCDLIIKTEKDILYTKKYRRIFPSAMLRISLAKIPEDAQYLDVSFVMGEKGRAE